MKAEIKACFVGQPFMAVVRGEGAEAIELTPIVYESDDLCGCGIRLKSGKAYIWSLNQSRDYITAWRGMEMLRLLAVIKPSRTIAEAYYSGQREHSFHIFQSYVNPLIKTIGQAAYHDIMSRAIPDKIIKAVLSGGFEVKRKIDRQLVARLIEAELSAGTVTWRDNFADYGIKFVAAKSTVVPAPPRKKSLMSRLFRL